uniref:Angiopoietin like 4 n=1 Tax=Chelydra serpentina TaxID=8475 RepID=A0A8C3TCZ7_CHESE
MQRTLSQLPPGSYVRNRPRFVWGDAGKGALATCCRQTKSGLILWLFLDALQSWVKSPRVLTPSCPCDSGFITGFVLGLLIAPNGLLPVLLKWCFAGGYSKAEAKVQASGERRSRTSLRFTISPCREWSEPLASGLSGSCGLVTSHGPWQSSPSVSEPVLACSWESHRIVPAPSLPPIHWSYGGLWAKGSPCADGLCSAPALVSVRKPCGTSSKLPLCLFAELPLDCQQLFLAGERSSGVFQIQPLGSQPFKVYCDMTAEGSWTVIQRRLDGSVDFDQLWEAYRNGFGDLSGDFWLGLEKVYHIVQERSYNLSIELQDWEGNSQLIQFLFSLGGENTAYTLSLLGPVSGELENALGDFRQLPFSTRDQDNDFKADTNCAKHLSGGWWFSTCGHANLNGKYFRSIPRQRHERKQGIFWKTWKGRYYPLKSTTLKIRPAELETES